MQQQMIRVWILWLGLLALVLAVPQAASGQDAREILRLGRPTTATFVWRPDRQVAAVARQGGVQLYRPDDTPLAWLPAHGLTADHWRNIGWSPDGQWLAVSHPALDTQYTTAIWSVSPDGQSASIHFQVSIQTQSRYLSNPFVWKPDSRQIAVNGHVFDVQSKQRVFSHRYGRARFDVQTGEFDLTERIFSSGGGMSWSPDGTRFVAIDYTRGGSGRVYALFADGSDERLFELPDSLTDLEIPEFTWSPDGSRLADDYGRIWDAGTGALLASYLQDQDFEGWRGHSSLLWTEDGDLLIQHQAPLLPWRPFSYLFRLDANSGEVAYKRHFWREIHTIGWQGDALVANTEDGYRLTLDPATGETLAVDTDHLALELSDLAWSPDSTRLVGITPGPPNYPMQLWDVAAIRAGGEARPVWGVHTDWEQYEREADLMPPDYARIRWLNDNELITTSRDVSAFRMFHSVERWDAETGQSRGRLYWSEGIRPAMAEPSPDGRLLAQTNTYSYMAEPEPIYPVDIIDAGTGETVLKFASASPDVAMWRPDGQVLATVGLRTGLIQLWDMADEPGVLIHSFDPDIVDAWGDLAWSPDGQRIVIGNKVYDPYSGTLVGFINVDPPYPYTAEWSPDSRILAVRSGGLVFWDVVNDRLIEQISLDAAFGPVAWSPDGSMLAIAMADGTIRIWDVRDLMAG